MSLEQLSYVASILGFPAIVLAICVEILRSAQERSRETQLELSRRYGEFLRLAMDLPECRLADTLTPNEVETSDLTEEIAYRQRIAFQTLVSLFEDAHFLLSGKLSPMRSRLWHGWEEYIKYWMSRPDFRHSWNEYFATQYSATFMKYMNERWPTEP